LEIWGWKVSRAYSNHAVCVCTWWGGDSSGNFCHAWIGLRCEQIHAVTKAANAAAMGGCRPIAVCRVGVSNSPSLALYAASRRFALSETDVHGLAMAIAIEEPAPLTFGSTLRQANEFIHGSCTPPVAGKCSGTGRELYPSPKRRIVQEPTFAHSALTRRRGPDIR
jgi:hypothetical protein